MWSRFGSPTKRATSGTEEEFNRALKRAKGSSSNIKLMFYFKDEPISPSKIDGEQVEKIKTFKRKISSEDGILYYDFVSADDFKKNVRSHLSKVVQDWDSEQSIKVKDNKLPLESVNPLANLLELDKEEDEVGLFDQVELANFSMDEVRKIVERMARALVVIGEKMTLRTEEIEKVNKTANGKLHKDVKKVINKTIEDLEVFIQKLISEIPLFQEHNSKALEAIETIIKISMIDFKEDLSELAGVVEYEKSILEASAMLKEFREVVSQLPRLTSSFNKTKRRVVAILNDLLNQFQLAAKKTQDIKKLMMP